MPEAHRTHDNSKICAKYRDHYWLQNWPPSGATSVKSLTNIETQRSDPMYTWVRKKWHQTKENEVHLSIISTQFATPSMLLVKLKTWLSMIFKISTFNPCLSASLLFATCPDGGGNWLPCWPIFLLLVEDSSPKMKPGQDFPDFPVGKNEGSVRAHRVHRIHTHTVAIVSCFASWAIHHLASDSSLDCGVLDS